MMCCTSLTWFDRVGFRFGPWANSFIQPVQPSRRARAPKESSRATVEMASHTTSPLRVGQVLEIGFPTFTPRITIRSERELIVEILAGDNEGFSDTVDYQALAVRDGLVILSWREHIGSTIVHVLDFISGEAYSAVTPAKGEFMRLRGRIQIK